LSNAMLARVPDPMRQQRGQVHAPSGSDLNDAVTAPLARPLMGIKLTMKK